MSPKSDEFRAQALAAEVSATAASDPEVKRKFLDIARSWHALADMVHKGSAVNKTTASGQQQQHGDQPPPPQPEHGQQPALQQQQVQPKDDGDK